MKTIVHLSDLHFGNADNKRIPGLIAQIKALHPDLVIISGDLTERATESQYNEAKEFISALELPLFVIPGNHDIPLYNVFKRLTAPFAKYHKFISRDTSPSYNDANLCIAGINSVRRYSISSGGIAKKQVEDAEALFRSASAESIKIVVSHHPFDMPEIKGYRKYTHRLMTSSGSALEKLSKSGVDLFLSGHLHIPFTGDTTLHHKIKGWGSILIHAGTASSVRTRGAPVSFNVLRIASPFLTVEHYDGNAQNLGYALSKTHNFKKNGKGWEKA
jgi:3',5'-cyclic AMP phosphodiesterase CpdA